MRNKLVKRLAAALGLAVGGPIVGAAEFALLRALAQ